LTKNEDTATEERIAHILSEAQAAMQAKDRQDNVSVCEFDYTSYVSLMFV
jgi:hypothetical protein